MRRKMGKSQQKVRGATSRTSERQCQNKQREGSKAEWSQKTRRSRSTGHRRKEGGRNLTCRGRKKLSKKLPDEDAGGCGPLGAVARAGSPPLLR